MTITTILRAAAVLLALIGLVDPSLEVRTEAPAPVDLRVTSADEGGGRDAHGVAVRLKSALEGRVDFNSHEPPRARVFVGGATSAESKAAADMPISTVWLSAQSSPNVRIVSAASPPSTPVGWAAKFVATVEAHEMSGRTSTIVLEHDGVELAHVDHAWSGASERAQIVIPYAPPVEGISRVTLRAQPIDGEATTIDNAADLRLAAHARRLKILVHEARPSWAAAFVRRALEQNPTFDVSTMVRASRGLSVRAGTPPQALGFEHVEPYDAILIGAPEELTHTEVDVLQRYARQRGGAIVLVPDRRPSGRYLDLLPTQRFDEVLIENAVDLNAGARGAMRASELAIPRDAPAGNVLASVLHEQVLTPVIAQWALGSGRVVFSGALDAWRFRAGQDGFSRFWEAAVADAALASPRQIEIEMNPAVARPGERVTVRATVRGTELDESNGRVSVPPVRARIVDRAGSEEVVRMWPAAELGVFEGYVRVPAVGSYDVQVSSGAALADDILLVAADVRHPVGDARAPADRGVALAAATGGVAVAPTDLGSLEHLLAGLQRIETRRTVRPARSVWFILTFAALACVEWALRRRNGLR